MREAITFDHHVEHRWLHFTFRLVIVLLLIFLLLVLTEDSIGKTRGQALKTAETLEVEQRLSDLGYWTGPVDGNFDNVSRQALMAFQKVEGRKRTGALANSELQALRSASRPEPRDPTFAHIEVDLSKQVLLIVDAAGTVTRVLSVCTGNGKIYTDRGRTQRAITPRGHFTVTRKINGMRISSLGALYYPSYIVNGIAIHGSPSMPPYPASHGCIRIPMFAAKEVSEMLPVGTIVDVYGG